MDEIVWFQIVLTSLCTGIGIGADTAIRTYFANKAFIQSIEKLVEALKKNGRQ